MGELFRDMSIDDCILRLSGTWVLGIMATGEEVPLNVREIAGTATNDGFHVKSVLASGYDDLIEVDGLVYECPALGYVNTSAGAQYLMRYPERQTKAGIPAPSTVVYQTPTSGSHRLDAIRYSMVRDLVSAAFLPSYVSLNTAMRSAGVHAVSRVLCIRSDGVRGTVFAPEFMSVGEFSIEGTTVQVKTEHPMLLGMLMGECHAVR